MKTFKPGDGQQMERLAATASTWRILNLHRATRTLRQEGGVETGSFFRNRRLNSAIIVKHTVREHERQMFAEPPIVATKVLVPLDENQPAAGAISFFVGERAYASIMRQTFGINTMLSAKDKDAAILAKLAETPSLELFLLRELIGGDEYGIAKDYFAVSLLEDNAIRTYITRELAPLIRIALPDANAAKVGKFVDSIFGAELGTQAADFFNSLGLPQKRWSPVVFSWKAALFYETQFAATQRRFDMMMAELAELNTYGHTEQFTRNMVKDHRDNLRGFAGRAFERSRDSSDGFNSACRGAIIERRDITELRTYLDKLPENVNGFGAFSAVIDHVLSYWSFRTRGFEKNRMPAEIFCQVATDICAMEVQFRVDPNAFSMAV